MVILTNVKLFNPETLQFEQWKEISIEDGLIKSMRQEMTENDTNAIDCKGLFVLPGLIDAHIHFFQSGGLYTRPDVIDLRNLKTYQDEQRWIRDNLDDTFKRYLASGVTAVVDCGGPFWNFEVRDTSMQTNAPLTAVTGPLISTVSRDQLDLGDPPIIQTETPEEAIDLVTRIASHIPVFIKIWFIYRPEKFDEDADIVKTTIQEAHRLGIRVAVHATELQTAKVAVRQGADILVHSVFDTLVDDEFIEMMVKNKVIYIPTLIVRTGYRDVLSKTPMISLFEERWGNPDVISSWFDMFDQDAVERAPISSIGQQNLERLAQAGAIIATGTDAGNIGTLHGPSIHREMEEMVRAGMTPAQVLQATTLNAAKVFGDPSLGKIIPGSPANLLILSRNPLNDISATTSIKYVISKGTLYRPEQLIHPNVPEWVIDQFYIAINSPGLVDLKDVLHPEITLYKMNSDKILAQGSSEVSDVLHDIFGKNGRVTLHSRIPLKNMIMDKVYPITNPMTPMSIYYEIRLLRISAIWIQ
ncbi:MAG: amidohydrolase [Methanobacteriota archaeon]|nr:MAG: amidohydrolase [Euryarchaeota archaeon]